MKTKPFTVKTVITSIESSINNLLKNKTKKHVKENDSVKLDISEEILSNFRMENYSAKTMFTKVFF